MGVVPVLDRFVEHLPKHPYCSDDLTYGCRPRVRQSALKHRYIALNQILRFYLVFDLDYPGAVLAPYDTRLPPPTLMTENRDNRHAHLLYELQEPVTQSENGRLKPIRFAAAVEARMALRLQADLQYAGLLTKNALSAAWEVMTCDHQYTLAELADYVDLPSRVREHVPIIGLGRNCAVFDFVRQWSYRNVGQYAAREAWANAVLEQAEIANQFPVPLPVSEVASIARSITKWTWQRRSELTRKHILGLPAIQASAPTERVILVKQHEQMGAAYARSIRQDQKNQRTAQARLLQSQKVPIAEIASTLRVSERWVYRLVNEVPPVERQRSTTTDSQQQAGTSRQTRATYLATHRDNADRPWEALGMSRRTWYRKGKPKPKVDQ